MAKVGRKSAYDELIQPHLSEITEWVKAGATAAEVANALGVSESTLHKYKSEKAELADAFKEGRAHVIIDIRKALLKKALGYEYQEKKKYIKKYENGEAVTYTEITTKHQPPSETAGAMLLRNYDPDWKDKDNTTTQLRQQEFELRKAIANDNSFDGLELPKID